MALAPISPPPSCEKAKEDSDKEKSSDAGGCGKGDGANDDCLPRPWVGSPCGYTAPQVERGFMSRRGPFGCRVEWPAVLVVVKCVLAILVVCWPVWRAGGRDDCDALDSRNKDIDGATVCWVDLDIWCVSDTTVAVLWWVVGLMEGAGRVLVGDRLDTAPLPTEDARLGPAEVLAVASLVED